MKYSVKYLLFVIIVFSCIWGSPKTVINIWHQMLYENRKVLREVCDDYEKNNPDIRINLTYRETEELRSSYQAAAMGGSGPELIYGPSDQVGPFSVMGIIQPLDELFPHIYFDQFVKKYGIQHYKRQLINNPRFFSQELKNIDHLSNSKNLASSEFASDSSYDHASQSYKLETNNRVPSIARLIKAKKLGLLIICHPILAFRLRRLLTVFILLKYLAEKRYAVAAKLVLEYIWFKSNIIKAFELKQKGIEVSLRKLVKTEYMAIEVDEEVLKPLREGR